MSEKILEIRHLSKTFGTNLVLKDIDFTVNSKDVTCIIGASGSGKTTSSYRCFIRSGKSQGSCVALK